MSAAVPEAWSLPADEVARGLRVAPAEGLSLAEVRERRRRHGPNRLRTTPRRGSWRILLDQFASLIVALLAVASVVALVFGEIPEAIAIAVVILLNAGIGFVTERRAVRSMEALRRLGHVTATVRRQGRLASVPAEHLVPGDVVLLEGGDVLSADLRLVEASKLEADESMLTGESLPVAKQLEPVSADVPAAERTCMLFKGTAVTRGSGTGIVVATGMATELGRISALIESTEDETTPLERRLERLGRRLIGLTLGIAVLVALAGLAGGRELYLVIEISIALAVATVPEGLPIVATVALARGLWRMARRRALVRRLEAVETLGSTGVILTDKTGTLTENRMTVAEIRTAEGDFELGAGGVKLDEAPTLREALRIGALCNNAELGREADGEEQGVGDPTELALLRAAFQAGLERRGLLERQPELREIAFDPQTKRMATVHRGEDGFFAAVKGAPEAVLEVCTHVVRDAGTEPLDQAARAAWLRRVDEMAARGERVLAVATRTLPSPEADPFASLGLVGVVGLLDPPRRGVREAIAACHGAGVRVVMLTGDHGATAWNVAAAVGLIHPKPDEPISFLDARTLPPLEDLAPERLDALLEAPVVARATPEQKLDWIELHQRAGHVVAMTGDGVNDAPALHKANIGVAMGRRGTQVAREAADMVLQDDEFGTIVAAVAQGRAIFANIRKFVLYLMSCNASEVLAVGAASLAQGPLPILPLQILFLNLVTDVFPALALGVGEGGPTLMRQPPRDPAEPILARPHWRFILGLGAAIAVAVLAALALALHWLGLPGGQATTVAFLTLALGQLWHVFSMRDPESGWVANEVTRNPWIWGAIVLCAALLLGAVYLPALADVLALEPPGVAGWTLAFAASLFPFGVGQLWLAWRREPAGQRYSCGPSG